MVDKKGHQAWDMLYAFIIHVSSFSHDTDRRQERAPSMGHGLRPADGNTGHGRHEQPHVLQTS